MHSFAHQKLPLSFNEMWITNRARNPNRILRDASDLYVPPHRIEIVKRMPICAFPVAWNSAPNEKENPAQHIFLKKLKEILIATLV